MYRQEQSFVRSTDTMQLSQELVLATLCQMRKDRDGNNRLKLLSAYGIGGTTLESLAFMNGRLLLTHSTCRESKSHSQCVRDGH